MAVALAEARKAAQEAASQQARTTASPAVARPLTAPRVEARRTAPAATPAAPVAETADALQAAKTAQAARAAARAEADRVIAAEAARRQSAQKVARVEADRRATIEAKAPVLAPIPAPAPVPIPEAAAEPAARAAEPGVAPEPAVAARAPIALKTAAQTLILLADDSRMVRVKTGRLLAGHDFQVVTAVDGLDAVKQLETCRPDLVITDVDMPGMDGFGLTRHLRENPITAGIPIVMITSAEDRHREDAQRAGVGLVLGKPYPEDELIAHIRSFRFVANHHEVPTPAHA